MNKHTYTHMHTHAHTPARQLLQPVVAQVQVLQARQRAEHGCWQGREVVVVECKGFDVGSVAEEGQAAEMVVRQVHAALQQAALVAEVLQRLQVVEAG